MAPIPLGLPGLRNLFGDASDGNTDTSLFKTHNLPISSLLKRAFTSRSTTQSLRSLPSQLRRREQMVSISNTYTGITSSPGVVVGIVLGTVVGFVVVVWLLFIVFGSRAAAAAGSVEDVEVRRSSSRRRQPEVVESSLSSASTRDDIVEVFEEESSQSRSSRGGYRTVDPRKYGGGDRPRRYMGH